MNEDGIALLLLPEDASRTFASAIDGIARTRAGADSWCDHCNHGDHLPCDLWGRDGCCCPHHENPEETR